MDITDALSRSRCRERRLIKSVKFCVFDTVYTFVSRDTANTFPGGFFGGHPVCNVSTQNLDETYTLINHKYFITSVSETI